jgi:hypothetical protein
LGSSNVGITESNVSAIPSPANIRVVRTNPSLLSAIFLPILPSEPAALYSVGPINGTAKNDTKTASPNSSFKT